MKIKSVTSTVTWNGKVATLTTPNAQYILDYPTIPTLIMKAYNTDLGIEASYGDDTCWIVRIMENYYWDIYYSESGDGKDAEMIATIDPHELHLLYHVLWD